MSLINWIILSSVKPIQKGQTCFKAGDELKSLYAIRSGTIKSYTIAEEGDEQITGFHLAVTWLDLMPLSTPNTQALHKLLKHQRFCEIPFETLDDLSGKMPNFTSTDDV